MEAKLSMTQGTTRVEAERSMNKWKQTGVAYLFMAPALILVIVFVLYPIVYSIPLSFFNYSVFGQTKFIGLENFTRAFQDSDFIQSLLNSAVFVLVVPPLQILSIIVASLVNRKMRGIAIFRVLYYIPVVTSMTAVGIIWNFLLGPQGIINTFLTEHHWVAQPIYFTNDARLAMPTLMFVTIWQGLGYYMMLYLAGLQSIPGDLEEAAKIDGAGFLISFIRIRLPLLKPYIWFCSLTSVMAAVGVFDVVFVMTGGGPNNATLVTNLYAYTQAFQNFDFGYAAAIGLVLAVVTTLFTTVVFIYGRRGGMSYGE